MPQLDNKLLSTIASSRDAFDKLAPYLVEHQFDRINDALYKGIKGFYEADIHVKSVDLELLRDILAREFPGKHRVVNEVISGFPEPASLPNVLKLLEDAKKEKIEQSMSSIISNPEADKTRLPMLMETYLSLNIQEQEDEIYNAPTIEQLESHFLGKSIVPLRPRELNDLIGGGVPRQSQVCIFARPDVGKSVVAINIAVGAAEDGYRVLYCGNEDSDAVMMYRVLSRFCRVPKSELNVNKEKWFQEAIQNGYRNLFFKAMAPGNYSELRKLIEKVKPDLVVLDQIRNMHFSKEGSMTINLEQGVNKGRELAKEFDLVMVVVTQAGNSAEQKMYLEMNDVEWSNTGVAAQCDLMIGIGQTFQMKEGNHVMLSFPKNKLCAPIKPLQCKIDYVTNRILT